MIAHLLQSTLFAVAAGLLTLLLKRNRARTRYWVWFTGLVKFLVPFGVLVSLGTHFPLPRWTQSAQAVTRPAISFVMGDIAQPVFMPTTPKNTTDAVPVILFCIWACGFVAIASWWVRRWMRVRADVRLASKLQIDIGIPALSSPALCEPGVFGIFRPILMLPDGMAEHLTKAEWEAILAHELCHIRCHDNLTAAIYMVVESVFWFHPLVWWMGTRLVAERERACDEEVLRLGSEPKIYAEGILKVCELYLESPLPCVAGVTGSNLRQRIRDIMTHRGTIRMSIAKKLVLAAAGVMATTLPIVVGVLNAPSLRSQTMPANRPTFEVASVKFYKDDGVGDRRLHNSYGPEGVDLRCALAFAVGEAYNFPVGRIVGPGSLTKEALWGALSQEYAIVAKSAQPASKDQLRSMLQSLLSDRFKLTMHREARTGPVYKLVVAKDGPKLDESKTSGDFSMSASNDSFVFANAEMIRISGFLSGRVDRVVVDQTGLKGLYNFTLRRPEELREDPAGAKSDGISATSPPAGAFADALKSLGLQLIAGTAPVDYLVVDHVESPSEN